ncbi:MAG TPA: DUF488 domain-containing protein [Thermoanaerobaculia bacterium]|nr:DUF488 domain-containing protein [Thermoanaerobaculia bacterium]
MRVFTIGHSTRSLSDLIGLLRQNAIERLADIRRYPGSRRHPHFSRESLAASLPGEGIDYVHMPELGGRREADPNSRNTALHNQQFRAYADYMAGPEFRRAVDALLDHRAVTAIMCAEAVPWRCHRNMVADDLVRRGIEVVHIIGKGETRGHEMSRFARIDGDHLIYDAGQQAFFGGAL